MHCGINITIFCAPDNTNNNSGRSEILDPLYEVLLYQKKDIIAIQKKLGTNSKANQTAVHQSNKAKTLPDLYELFNKTHEASMDISIGEIYNLLVCLEEDIITIQDELEDDPGVVLKKYGEMGVKKIRFTEEGLPLIPNLTPQQLYEVFVKNSASTNHCLCLEQVS
ncbi:4673_t:CDS:2 [Dentiscutata erythropus]|uniref:4673_t:CDS:1 n=1 Tax=Dentiscutata erythropus TaxID=1348616 RepID=A0A9N9I8H6_9GLOM|nr:4673_t:CDS:2 [Dentiscutata erythropus]